MNLFYDAFIVPLVLHFKLYKWRYMESTNAEKRKW